MKALVKKSAVFASQSSLAILAGLLISLGSTAAQAQIGINPGPSQPPANSNCIPASDMTAIAQDFPQFNKYAGKEFCLNKEPISYLMAGLAYIRKVQFVDNMVNSPDQLFSGVFAKNWYGYFTERIKTVTIESSCPAGAVAYVMGFFHNNEMHVCPIGLTAQFSPMDLASVFLHEARHIDGFAHITCSKGPRAGIRGACDKAISDAGSYAVTVETYAQLGAYGKDIHPAYKAIAEASSLIYAEESFEVPVKINKIDAFLAVTEDKKIYRLNSNLSEKALALGTLPTQGRFLKSKASLLLLPDNKNEEMVRVFQTGETQSIATEYNKLTPQQRSQVVDYYLAWTWNAKVEKNKVVFFCDKINNPTSSKEVALPAGAVAEAVIYPEGYAPSTTTALLKTNQGVLKIGCSGGQGSVSDAGINVDSQYVRIHKANNSVIGLTAAGQLYDVSTKNVTRIDLGSPVKEITSYSRAAFFDGK